MLVCIHYIQMHRLCCTYMCVVYRGGVYYYEWKRGAEGPAIDPVSRAKRAKWIDRWINEIMVYPRRPTPR